MALISASSAVNYFKYAFRKVYKLAPEADDSQIVIRCCEVRVCCSHVSYQPTSRTPVKCYEDEIQYYYKWKKENYFNGAILINLQKII